MYINSRDNYYSKMLKDQFIKTNNTFSYETIISNDVSLDEFNALKEEVEHLRSIVKKLAPEEFI